MRRFGLTSTTLGALIGLGVIALAPRFITNNYHLNVLTFVAIHAIIAVGLNLLMGYAGQISLGHGAFYGLGAYSSAVLTTRLGWSPWTAILAGVAITAFVAFLIGRPCLKLKGHYLAIATLGFGLIVYIFFKEQADLTGGTSGITDIPNLRVGALVFDNDLKRFYLAWAITVIALVVGTNIVNSRVGRALRAVHGSEPAAATLGIDVARYKVQIFVVSAAYASVAGSLYAHCTRFVNPEPFGMKASVELVVMVVIGGMASIWGALFGSGTITILGEAIRALGEQIAFFNEFDTVIFGLILMGVMIFMPEGLTRYTVDHLARKLRTRRAPKAAEAKEKVAAR